MQHPSSKKLPTARFDEMYELLLTVAQPDSPANKEQMQLITVRLTQMGVESAEKAANRVGTATDKLTHVIREASEQSQLASQALVALNKRLLWLTLILVVLTVLLTAFGAVQLVKEFWLIDAGQAIQGRDTNEGR